MDTETDAGLAPLTFLKDRADAPPSEAAMTPEPAIAEPAAEPLPETLPADAAPVAAPEPWTKPAYLDEKAKRQAAEKRAADLEAELERVRQTPAEQADNVLDPISTDPKQYAFALRAQQSEMVMESLPDTFPNYRETVTLYADAAKRGEAPMPPWNHPHPAKFAYEQGMKIKAMAEIGDPQTYRQRVIDEYAAEQKAKADAERKKLAGQVMDTAAGDRNAAPRENTDVYDGPRPLRFKKDRFKQK